jgi:hypothetical protein
MFIDESRAKEKELVLVVGLIVPARRIFEICQKVDKCIKRCVGKKYSFLDSSFNLKWIRKTRSEKNSFKIGQTKLFRLSKGISETLVSSHCSLLCSIRLETENNTYADAIRQGLYFVLERFFYFLCEKDSYGIAISDEPASGKLEYRSSIIEQVRSSEFWGEGFGQRIYQDFFFTRDEWDPLIQVTDFIAHILSSYIRKCLEDLSLSELSSEYDFRYKMKKNRYFGLILPLIRHRPDGKVSGYGVKL